MSEQNYVYTTSDCHDGMNPLNYYDATDIAARLNTMFNAYMASESNPDALKANHWLVACIADHFQGIRRRDDLMDE